MTPSSAAEGGLQVDAVDATYDGRPLLRSLTLTVAPSQIVGLLGPSGSGKSTLLRIIAGVQRPDSGSIRWDGLDITAEPAHRRSIGLVFQDPLLFPHLDVARNVGFGLTSAHGDASVRRARIDELLQMVDLPGFGGRTPRTLSGGEAQRVALARALAPRPRMLLLDEPFSALDRDLRERLAADVRALLKATGTPAIHVTHDADEAGAIADEVVHLSALQR